MNESTTRTADWLLADDVLREVIGGETGDLVRDHVEMAIEEMRRNLELDPDYDTDRHAAEASDYESGGLFPYTYTMAQAWAESIHHATYEPDDCDLEIGDTSTAFGAVCASMSAMVYAALRLAAERLEEESDEEE